MTAPLDRWEFWIDVGGTFTDCFARRPDGSLARHKLLSSGATVGAAATGSDAGAVIDPVRCADPAGFWLGFRLAIVDASGAIAAESSVAGFDKPEGRLKLADPLPLAPTVGQSYEMRSEFEAPVLAIRYLLGLDPRQPVPPVAVRLGTTRGTNALLTRRGARTALAITRGFGDLLSIGYQNRPKLFELSIHKPLPLAAAVLEIDERVTHDGTVLTPPDTAVVRRQLQSLLDQGIESLAVCLLHSYAHPGHEERVGKIATDVGFVDVSLSSRVASLEGIVARGDTTVVDAYLNPVLKRYVAALRAQLPGSDVRLLTSAGGLVAADSMTGKDSILSGPAGGVIGFSRVAQAAHFERAIGFDMGGTSTDVSRFDGRRELEYETEKAGVRIVAPMLAIETVAAGGGSIARFDGVRLLVGPDSAGAEPGPACYGRGGPLTVTDCNVWLGRIPLERFPFPLRRATVAERLQTLAGEMAAAGLNPGTTEQLAEGIVRVANAAMVKAIRSVSIAKGCDVRDYVLVSFGGAAGQHACAVAGELGIRQILCHADAGLLSAYGIGLADVERRRATGVYTPHSEGAVRGLAPLLQSMADEAVAEVRAEGVLPAHIDVRRTLDLRVQGTDASLTIPTPDVGTYAEAFAAEHRKLYGYVDQRRELEIVAARVEVVGRSARELPSSTSCAQPPVPLAQRGAVATGRLWFDGAWHAAAHLDRRQLLPGDRLDGPAVICEPASTTVVDPHWRAEVLSQGELLLTPADVPAAGRTVPTAPGAEDRPDPFFLEVFNHQLAGIAEQMGHTLRNTASSVNVKQRLDYSCAVFTADGELAASAAHIPVHLGAMAETVKAVLADNPSLAPGDVLATNDPYRGGSHLPDVTVVTPLFDSGGKLLLFAANRAHHAEIGGSAPGSMPPFSRNLAEEGVLVRNFKLVERGHSRLDEFGELLQSGPYPSRDVPTNLADVAAQIAANRQGAGELAALVERHTLPVVTAYMGHVQAAAERKVRQALARLPQGTQRFVDNLDDGSPIAVTVQLAGQCATIDFSGTGPVLPGNLNANRAIVTAAVMYVLRCLIGEEIPLNHGMLAPIELILPECLLNPPRHERPEDCAAMAGGNVETSQRVVDVLLGALELAAASQGTMNNLLFGDATFGYYETLCGGAGATADSPGADAVHTHMTNTRLTDPEVLERRYPVRLREFSIRRGSGGAGSQRGGDGVVRRIEFLRPLDVSVLSQRRGPFAPYGLRGGQPGELGRNVLHRADGTIETLPAIARFGVLPGDVLCIETPGGGGWGSG